MNQCSPASPRLTIRKWKAVPWAKKKSHVMRLSCVNANREKTSFRSIIPFFSSCCYEWEDFRFASIVLILNCFRWLPSLYHKVISTLMLLFNFGGFVCFILFVLFLVWFLTEMRHPQIAVMEVWNNVCVCALIQKRCSTHPCCPTSRSRVWEECSGGEERDPTAVPLQEKLIKLTLCEISENPRERETLQARLH